MCRTHNISSFERFTNNGRVSTTAIPFLHPTKKQNYKLFILQWTQSLEKHHPHTNVQPKAKYIPLKGHAGMCNAPVTSGVQRSAVMCDTC